MATWPCAALADADLSARTTMRVGGRARWLLEPATPRELAEAVSSARARGFEPRILGGGANLIVDDGLYDGVVITTDRIKRLFRVRDANDGTLVENREPDARIAPAARDEGLRFVAWCGTSLPKLVGAASELGWSGVEGLAGVPGNVGGGVAMNAGGRWGEAWDVVERVLVVDARGELVELARAECAPSYRNGNLGGAIVAAAVFHLRLDEVAAVKGRARTFLIEKNRAQPVTAWSAGCVFKNPPKEASDGLSAGQLIEQCGLKGRAIGGALVSTLHGNFIVNLGSATARDVFELIDVVRGEVARQRGLELELEAKVWRSG